MHLIKKQTLDIECTSEPLGKEVHSVISNILEKEFYPQLELLLNRYSIENEITIFDSISIALPSLNAKNWKNELVNHALVQVEDYLKTYRANNPKAKHSQNGNSIPSSTHALNLFIGYLNTGILDENPSYKTVTELENFIVKNSIDKNPDVLIKALMHLFKNNTPALTRYIYNVSAVLKSLVIKNISNFPVQLKNRLHINLSIGKSLKINEYKLNQITEYLTWSAHIFTTQTVTISPVDIQKFVSGISGEVKMHEKILAKISASEELLRIPYFKEIALSVNDNNEINLKETTAVKQKNKGSEAANKDIEPNTEQNKKALLKPTDGNDKTGYNENIAPTYEDKIEENEDYKTIENHKEEEAKHTDADGTEKLGKPIQPEIKSINQYLYIENGGLVLLYPFLPALFTQLGLYKNNEWVSYKAHHKAVLITQHLVSGTSTFDENQMMLNRILCGFTPADVINTKIRITKKDRAMCNDLLQAVIKHWSILKDTSPTALQQTFLMRQAKLSITNETMEMWVEQSGVDILLEKLPWGIGMVKTPWMNVFLQCYWH
jgi:Contractile injection system tape measure protein